VATDLHYQASSNRALKKKWINRNWKNYRIRTNENVIVYEWFETILLKIQFFIILSYEHLTAASSRSYANYLFVNQANLSLPNSESWKLFSICLPILHNRKKHYIIKVVCTKHFDWLLKFRNIEIT